MQLPLFTIGHSNHSADEFVSLLRQHRVQAVADVRSRPYSGFAPHFGREALHDTLAEASVKYVFLGRELGARSDNPNTYKNGRVEYSLLAKDADFAEGIERVLNGLKKYSLALMCAEKDPADCHRALLVARHLKEQHGLSAQHIHPDREQPESQEELETRLLQLAAFPEEGDMFSQRSDFLTDAYKAREEQVAYKVQQRGRAPE